MYVSVKCMWFHLISFSISQFNTEGALSLPILTSFLLMFLTPFYSSVFCACFFWFWRLHLFDALYVDIPASTHILPSSQCQWLEMRVWLSAEAELGFHFYNYVIVVFIRVLNLSSSISVTCQKLLRQEGPWSKSVNCPKFTGARA